MVQSLVKQTLSEQIYDILKGDILSGGIRLGDKLINRELQERFHVSSTPIRDAINKLYQDGLVQNVTKAGAQLIDFDPAYAEEINQFIAFMSCEALSLSAQNTAREDVLADLTKYQTNMEQHLGDDQYFDDDFRFHKTFFNHCGNRFLKETYKRYNLIRFLMIRYAIRTPEDRMTAVVHHKAITDAYAHGDFDTARELTLNHYMYGMRLVNGYFSAQ